MRFGRARRSPSGAVAVAVLLCILASCSPSSTPSTTSPPETTAAPATSAQTTATPAEACADVAALKSSLEALTKVRPLQDGVGALTTAIDNVKIDLDKAEGSASEALQPSVQQVKTAFEGLQTAASGLTTDNLKEKAPAIGAALTQLATATRALSSKLRESCPGT
jgi:glucose/arabinose dehydrogenase